VKTVCRHEKKEGAYENASTEKASIQMCGGGAESASTEK